LVLFVPELTCIVNDERFGKAAKRWIRSSRYSSLARSSKDVPENGIDWNFTIHCVVCAITSLSVRVRIDDEITQHIWVVFV